MSKTSTQSSNVPGTGIDRSEQGSLVSHHQVALGEMVSRENPRELDNEVSVRASGTHAEVPIEKHPAWLLSLGRSSSEALNLLSDELQQHSDSIKLKLLTGICLLKTRSYKAAEVLLKEILRSDPDNSLAKYYCGHALLHLDDWQNGFKLIEESRNSRRHDLERSFYKDPSRFWTGQDLKGKHIVILGNGAESEEIAMSRYVECLRKLNPRLVGMVCSSARLLGMMQSLRGINRVDLSQFEPFDYFIPVGLLPFMFGTKASSVPPEPRLLEGSSVSIGTKRSRLPHGKPILGICWRQRHDEMDSVMGIERHTFANSLDLDDVERILCELSDHYSFMSLQSDSTPFEEERFRRYGMFFPDSPDFEKYSVVADWMACVDGVLSVDSPIAHIAGSYGINCKVMLPYSPNWIWGKHLNKTPWYSRVSLYRQRIESNWDCLLPTILRELQSQAFVQKSSVAA